MIKVEKLYNGYVMTEQLSTGTAFEHERGISTIPELRRAIGGWCVGQINKGSYSKYTVEIKGVK